MNINRKYIIIFGTLILLLVIITGAITYYKEKGTQIPRDISIPIPEEKEHLIWCYYGNIPYDCSNREFFKPGEPIAISVNLIQFNNIPYEPYSLCYYTDLKGEIEGKKICWERYSSPKFLIIEETTIPKNKDIFTLLRIDVFPNQHFEETEAITIIDLTGKLIK